jgi:hypothetical protein
VGKTIAHAERKSADLKWFVHGAARLNDFYECATRFFRRKVFIGALLWRRLVVFYGSRAVWSGTDVTGAEWRVTRKAENGK